MQIVLTVYSVAWRLLTVMLLWGLLLVGIQTRRALLPILARMDTISANVEAATGNVRVASAALSGKHGIGQLLYNANVVTAQIGRTANQVRLASVEERKQAELAGKGLIAAIGKFDGLLDETNKKLNGDKGVLATLASDLAKTGVVLDQVGGEGGLVATGTKSLAAAGDVVTGLQPDLQRATKNFADMAGHGSGAVANVEETTGIIRDSMKPKKVGFWGRLANAVMPTFARGLLNAFFPERVKVVNEVQTTGAKK